MFEPRILSGFLVSIQRSNLSKVSKSSGGGSWSSLKPDNQRILFECIGILPSCLHQPPKHVGILSYLHITRLTGYVTNYCLILLKKVLTIELDFRALTYQEKQEPLESRKISCCLQVSQVSIDFYIFFYLLVIHSCINLLFITRITGCLGNYRC